MTLEDMLNVMYDAKKSSKGLQLVTDANIYNLSSMDILQVSSLWEHPRGGHPQLTYIVLPDKTKINVKNLVSVKKL